MHGPGKGCTYAFAERGVGPPHVIRVHRRDDTSAARARRPDHRRLRAKHGGVLSCRAHGRAGRGDVRPGGALRSADARAAPSTTCWPCSTRRRSNGPPASASRAGLLFAIVLGYPHPARSNRSCCSRRGRASPSPTTIPSDSRRPCCGGSPRRLGKDGARDRPGVDEPGSGIRGGAGDGLPGVDHRLLSHPRTRRHSRSCSRVSCSPLKRRTRASATY